MSIFENPSFYISIFSSVCFVASEILPFLPVKGNGIIHAIVECLSHYKDNSKTTNNPLNENNIEIKLDQVIQKLDKIQGEI